MLKHLGVWAVALLLDIPGASHLHWRAAQVSRGDLGAAQGFLDSGARSLPSTWNDSIQRLCRTPDPRVSV